MTKNELNKAVNILANQALSTGCNSHDVAKVLLAQIGSLVMTDCICPEPTHKLSPEVLAERIAAVQHLFAEVMVGCAKALDKSDLMDQAVRILEGQAAAWTSPSSLKH